jgi:uncharacterized protein YjgD (DUF1641 family)
MIKETIEEIKSRVEKSLDVSAQLTEQGILKDLAEKTLELAKFILEDVNYLTKTHRQLPNKDFCYDNKVVFF